MAGRSTESLDGIRKETPVRNIVAVVLLAASVVTYAADGEPGRHVYLRSPEALEKLSRENPQHHAKIQRILAEVGKQSIDSVPRWMKAEFGAEGVVYIPTLLTSYPAKNYIHFKLDDTSYTAVLVQPQTERAVPVK